MARWLGWTHPKLPPVDLTPSCRCLSRLPCSECKAWGAHCQRTSILSPYLHSEAVAHKGDQRSPMSGRYTAPSPWGRICFSSEQCLSLHCFPAKKNQGEVLEWLKRHAWKVCKRQKRFAGSNQRASLSAEKERVQITSDLHPFAISPSGEYHSNQPYYPKKLFYHSSSFPSN